jgi:hypothetical protein
VRLVAPENPLGRSTPIEAGLEEGYMAVMAGFGKEAAYA